MVAGTCCKTFLAYTGAHDHPIRVVEGEGLPAPVWMIFGALRKALKPENDRDLNGVPSVRVQTRSGRWLPLHGARTEPRPRRGGETMVIIEPTGPQELAWLRVSAYGLSERERAVVDLVVQGASTKEITKALYISEYTVQDHLSNAFDKVGVRGRRTWVPGTALDVWEIVAAYREMGRERVLEESSISEDRLDAALAYYKARPDEINQKRPRQ